MIRITANKAFESSQVEEIEMQKKINSALAITKHSSYMKRSLESFSIATKVREPPSFPPWTIATILERD